MGHIYTKKNIHFLFDPWMSQRGRLLRQRSTELRESNTFMASSKHTCSSDPREAVHHSSRLLAANVILRSYSSKEPSGPFILGTKRVCRDAQVPKKVVSPKRKENE